MLHNPSWPVYYDYGTTLYYEGDKVYYNGELVATAEEYAAQAEKIAAAAADADSTNVEWMPLGVFALAKKGRSAADSTFFFHLAISKKGIIAGSYQDTASGQILEVEGTIDVESQRAAWGPVGKRRPVIETGIYNLTENEAGALIHHANGQTEQWKLFRLEEPQESTR